MEGDPEDDYGLEPSATREFFNSSTEGFQDDAGAYPLIDKRDGSDVNTGSSRKITKNKNNRVGRPTLDSSAYSSKNIIPTRSQVNPQYPHNQVTETPGGHIIEYDDTPGFERINIQHKNGSYIAIYANGDTEVISEGNSYSVTTKDKNVVVRGECNVVIESNANIRVKGDANIETNGDMNQVVHGDYNLEVNGNHSVTVHGNLDEKVTGNRFEQTRGNTTHYNLSNYNQTITNNQAINIGGNFSFTGQGTYSTRTFGEVQMSYAGGLITVDGFDVEGNPTSGKIVSNEFFGADAHLDNLYLSANANISGTLTVSSTGDFGGQVTASSVHASTLEGTATRATFATEAGTAGTTDTVTPTSPSPDTADSPTARSTEPTSGLTVVDVQGNSTPLIVNLDRSAVNGGFGTRKLSTSEVTSRCRNTTLMKNGTWLVDQIGLGSVLDTITSSSPPSSKRTGVKTTLSAGKNRIGNTKLVANFDKVVGSVNNTIIPTYMKITESPSPSKRLSPNYYLSHMLAGDSEAAQLKEQLGLTDVQIAVNMQVLAYSILEKIRYEFDDIFTISEGFYSLYTNEKIDDTSFAFKRAQGLGVGLQFPQEDNSVYFDVAQWCQNNLVFDTLTLSYIDYDPEKINEPTLLISVNSGTNKKEVGTEFNHVNTSSSLEDYSNGS